MRIEGWEQKLHAIIEEARDVPYKLGEHDCFRVACKVQAALIGVDRWAEFEGQYSTVREAMELIAKHGSNFEQAFDWFFGVPNISVKLARRGDICALQTKDGQKHLGVCLGVATALLSPTGLIFDTTLKCLCTWRIG